MARQGPFEVKRTIVQGEERHDPGEAGLMLDDGVWGDWRVLVDQGAIEYLPAVTAEQPADEQPWTLPTSTSMATSTSMVAETQPESEA